MPRSTPAGVRPYKWVGWKLMHGTVAAYNRGCKCASCRKARAKHDREMYRKRKAKAIDRAQGWAA